MFTWNEPEFCQKENGVILAVVSAWWVGFVAGWLVGLNFAGMVAAALGFAALPVLVLWAWKSRARMALVSAVGVGLLLAGCSPDVVLVNQVVVPPPVAHAVTVTPEAQAEALPVVWEDGPMSRMVTVTPYATPYPTCTVSTGVDGGKVYIRGGPGMGYAVSGVVYEGDRLLIREERGGWARVSGALSLDAAEWAYSAEGWFYVAKWCQEKKESE